MIQKKKYQGSIPAGLPFNNKVLSTLDKLKQKKMPWDDIDTEPSKETLKVLGNSMVIERYGDPDSPVFLLLPIGKMDHIIPAILHSGYQVIVVNFPGINDSPGKPLSCRSELILEKG